MSLEYQLCESIGRTGPYDIEKIASLLQQGADPNKAVCDYGTAMHCAFNFARDELNWVKVINMLLDNGGDPFVEYPHEYENERYTPVMTLVGSSDLEITVNAYEREEVAELIYKKYCNTRDLKFRLLKDLCRTGEGLGTIGKYDYIDTMNDIMDELIKENYLTNEKYNELFKHTCAGGYSFARALYLFQHVHLTKFKLEPLDKETLDSIKQLATEREGEDDNTALEFIKEYEKWFRNEPKREMSAIEKYKQLKAQKEAERAVKRESLNSHDVNSSSFLNEVEKQKAITNSICLKKLKEKLPELNRNHLIKYFGKYEKELIIGYDYDNKDEFNNDVFYSNLKTLLENLKQECDNKIIYTLTFIPETEEEYAYSEIKIKLVDPVFIGFMPPDEKEEVSKPVLKFLNQKILNLKASCICLFPLLLLTSLLI